MIFSKDVQAILIDWLNSGVEAEAEIMKAALGLRVKIDDMTTIADAAALRMMPNGCGDWPAVDDETAQDAEAILDEIAHNYNVYIEYGAGTRVEERHTALLYQPSK